MLKSLSALPCFNQVTRVSVITDGLSNPCFKVVADDRCYFAKFTNEKRLSNELKLAKTAAVSGITPSVYYHDDQWFISHYIEGENLAVKQMPLIEKITTSIALMIQFHRLSTSNPENINTESIDTETMSPLSITDTINGLLRSDHKASLITVLNTIAHELEAFMAPEKHKTSKKMVCCHSDINFSNVLSDNEQRTWLIDFEYACFAPIEFDLAMLLAVNNIPNPLINFTINAYQQQANIDVETKLLNPLLLFCYFINGLWYYNMSLDAAVSLKHSAQDNLLKLATKQWQAFDRLHRQLTRSKNTMSLQQFI